METMLYHDDVFSRWYDPSISFVLTPSFGIFYRDQLSSTYVKIEGVLNGEDNHGETCWREELLGGNKSR